MPLHTFRAGDSLSTFLYLKSYLNKSITEKDKSKKPPSNVTHSFMFLRFICILCTKATITKIKTKIKFPFQKVSSLSLRALPAFDFPVKKLPVTSTRLGSIFDFHCSLTKPPGMLLFKHGAPSPQTTAAVKGGRNFLANFIDFA